ncbi:MAG: glutaredoxin family protein [Fidelibacterota bacterium]
MNAENTIKVQLITRPNCSLCRKVETQLEHVLRDYPDIDLEIFNVDIQDVLPSGRQSFITPAVWVKDSLWFMGTMNPNRFRLRLDQLISANT